MIDPLEIVSVPDKSKIRKNPFYEGIVKDGFAVTVHYSPKDAARLVEGKRRLDDFDLFEHDADELEAFEEYKLLERQFEKLRARNNIGFSIGNVYFKNNPGHLFELKNDMPFPSPTIYDCSSGKQGDFCMTADGRTHFQETGSDGYRLLLMWQFIQYEDVQRISMLPSPVPVRFYYPPAGDFVELVMTKDTFNNGVKCESSLTNSLPPRYEWASLVLKDVYFR